ncbi:hypothetical protein ACT3R7_10745 [Halomonas sp. AOP43-A1-21]
MTSAVALLLTGCASTQSVDGSFATLPGVTLSSDGSSNQYFESARFDYDSSSVSGDALEYCIASIVENRGVSLTGETASYISPFTGIRYSNEGTRETAGGQVIAFASDDKSEVVANGTTNYRTTFGMVPIERAVQYRLSARALESGLSLIFDSLKQAQLNTGVSANTGYNRIGAWSGAGASHAYDSLRSVAQDIQGCVANR